MKPAPEEHSARPTSAVVLIAAWLGVGIPMLWGVLITMKKAALLFK